MTTRTGYGTPRAPLHRTPSYPPKRPPPCGAVAGGPSGRIEHDCKIAKAGPLIQCRNGVIVADTVRIDLHALNYGGLSAPGYLIILPPATCTCTRIRTWVMPGAGLVIPEVILASDCQEAGLSCMCIV